MSTDQNNSNDRERLQRLERTVARLKIGLAITLVAVALLLIPPIARLLGLLLYFAIVAGAMMALITGLVYLLERFFLDEKKS
jgi:predicted membrane channel-forming protein YqfA (hemolysin III family)